jgi:hypothetical protein
MLGEARTIFSDNNVPLHQRIEAAALVLKHEASPDLIADATEFLQAVAISGPTSYKLKAIEALAKREVPKAGTPGDGGGSGWIDRRRERWQSIALADRRLALMRAGEWPPDCGEVPLALWAGDILSDRWIAPEDDPPGWKTGDGMTEALAFGRKRLHAENSWT